MSNDANDETLPRRQALNLFTALARAQAKFGTPQKTKTANAIKFSYKYSSLDDLIAATRPALNEEGVFLTQSAWNEGAKVFVSTTLLHESGEQWASPPVTLTAEDASPQKVGSAITYGRRYSMSATLGVAAEEDDDGHAASEPQQQRRAPGRPPRQPEPRDAMTNELPSSQAPAQPAGQLQKVGTGDKAAYPGCITLKQVKQLFVEAEKHHVPTDALKSFLADGGITKTDLIPVDRYDGIIMAIKSGHVGAKDGAA